MKDAKNDENYCYAIILTNSDRFFKVFLVKISTDWVEKKLLKRLVHTYNPYRDFKNGLKGAKSQNGSLKRTSNITIFKLHKY